MKYLFALLVVLLVGCTEESASKTLSYEELVNYPNQCAKADQQLAELKKLQAIKNFDPDPDKLSEADRAYNSRLKATIWWYAYRCEK